MFNKLSSIALLLVLLFFLSTCNKDNFNGSVSKIGNPKDTECLLSKRVFSPDVYCDIIYDDNKKVIKNQWSNGNYRNIEYNEFNQVVKFEDYKNEELVKLTTLDWNKNTVVIAPVDNYDLYNTYDAKSMIEFDSYGQPVKQTIYRADTELGWKTSSYFTYTWHAENLIKMQGYRLNKDDNFEIYLVEEYEYDQMINPKRFMTTVVFDGYMHYASKNNLLIKKSRLMEPSYNIVDYLYEYNDQGYPIHAEFSETLVEGIIIVASYFYMNNYDYYSKVKWEYSCDL